MASLVEDDLDFSEYDDDEVFAEDDDYEGWDKDREVFGEAARPPRYQRKYTNGSRPVTRRPPVVGLRGVSVQTPAGRAQVKFEKPVATKESVEKLSKRADELAKKVDMDLDKNTKILDTKINATAAEVKKVQQSAQMGMLLPLLLTKPPQIEKITVGAVQAGETAGTAAGNTIRVAETTLKKDDNLLPLLAVMMMSGGLGGSSSDSSNMMMPLMLLAVSGGFGSNK